LRHKEKKLNLKKLDFILLITMTILIAIGAYCISQAFMLSDERNAIMLKQFAGVLIGYVMIAVTILIDYRFISKLSLLLYIIMNGVLAVTLVMGSNVNNVNRWIVILGIPFQPSELMKIVLILFLAFLCNRLRGKLNKIYILFLLTGVVAIPMVLIMLEPHLSSALAILFVFCIMIYCSGIGYKVIGAALAFVLPIVIGIVVAVSVFDLKLPFIENYQINRVLTFLSDDESDKLNGDFQQNQSIGAIGSGGLQGKLIFSEEAKVRNYSEIYAKESDFVFSIIGEDFGFIGSFLVILLYAVLIFRCLMIARHAPDYAGKLICIGVSSYFMFQIFINIGVATMLIPNTGLPLPFISNGLTSLISSMLAVGIVLNIGVRQREKSTEPFRVSRTASC
jgi:rod shape determining protein RodA